MSWRNHPLLFGLIALLGPVVLAGCGGGGSGGNPAGQFETVSPRQLWTELFSAQPPTVLDVRSANAYALSHLPHSLSSPGCGCAATLSQAPAPPVSEVVVGVTEDDEHLAATPLLLRGEHVRLLAGGLSAWKLGLDINDTTLHGWLLAARNLRLLDVRTPAEWQAKRIAGTENKPLANIDQWAPTLSPTEEFVLICSAGQRSTAARDNLAKRGLTKIHNLLGGTEGWHFGWVGNQVGG